MIIINQTTANQMIENDSSLLEITDIYGRRYLLGMGAEILIIADDSDLIERINQRNQQKEVIV
jgi:hypothetical protein